MAVLKQKNHQFFSALILLLLLSLNKGALLLED